MASQVGHTFAALYGLMNIYVVGIFKISQLRRFQLQHPVVQK